MKNFIESNLGKTILILVSLSVYLGVFLPIYSLIGLEAAAFAVLPIIVSAWLWGLRVGLLIGILSFPLNTLLLNLVGYQSSGWDVIIRNGGGLGSAALVLVSLVVGRLSDLGRDVKKGLEERQRAEGMLRGVQDELELGVRERTKELVRANEALQAEISERKRTEENLTFMAHHDHLTGLANHTMFSDQLTRALARSNRNDQLVGVMFLDLDRFKGISETFGHAVGDMLLKGAAKRLEECVRKVDTVARWGGDEFTIILEGITREQDAATVAGKVVDTIVQPFTLEDHEVFVTASIGITIFPHDGKDVNTLTKNADAAMYRAKEKGRNTYQFYAPDMNAKAFERLSLENSLRRALEREEFILYYQPRVSLNSGQMIGMEVLLRWDNPELGMVSPAEFIPLAEETGLIASIGEWVLKTACSQNKAWQSEGFSPLILSVNLSAQQFRQKDLAGVIGRTLSDTDLEPKWLELELTESLLMEDTKVSSGTLEELRAMGLSVSVDDFGTGYSSLGYLKRFPLDTLKIDQSFVRDIPIDPDSAAIANSIIALARSLRLNVVAEGVETVEQLSFLREVDCDEIQGYLFSEPLPPDDFKELLRSGKSL